MYLYFKGVLRKSDFIKHQLAHESCYLREILAKDVRFPRNEIFFATLAPMALRGSIHGTHTVDTFSLVLTHPMMEKKH